MTALKTSILITCIVDMEMLDLKRKVADTMAEVSVYNVRLDEISDEQKEEFAAGERIKKATPIEMNVANCDVSAAVAALQTASSILTEYYTNMNPYDRYEGLLLKLLLFVEILHQPN